MKIRILTCRSRAASRELDAFLEREPFDRNAEAVAQRVLDAVRKDGDRAVAACAAKFDRARLNPKEFRVGAREIKTARKSACSLDRRLFRAAHGRVAAFARAGMQKDWQLKTPRGGHVGEKFTALDRVGIYVPGGAAPLASTALMTVTLAKVAGVREIAACTPCGPDKTVPPFLLYALDECGATEIYRIGGIHAIGAMAFGTKTVRKVQMIAGPGGPYVTAAKRLVYGHVALDMPAGPSEIAVLADSSAEPRLVAADLLSQAEHGTGREKCLLVTDSMKLAVNAARELVAQSDRLSRTHTVRRVMKSGMLIAVVPDLRTGIEVCNRFAPEHLEIMTRNPSAVLPGIKRAGAVFLGPWSPESAGDYVAGPSHVLPTGGTAAMFSGLTAGAFRRRSSVISFTRADLRETLSAIEMFARIEGLDAHAKSARIRFANRD